MKIEKRNNFINDILIIDGLWGTGKSLLGPVISGMSGVENFKEEHIFEYVCHLNSFDKISDDAAIWLLRNYSDLSQYNNLISREVNLRWSDDSGLSNNPNKFKYIKRIFGDEGDKKVDEINSKNLALCIMSHMLLLTQKLLKEAYGERVKIIEVVRHPLYMVQHWKSGFERFDSSRSFTPSIFYKNQKMPWFTETWKEEFYQCNLTEKSVISICKLYPLLYEKIKLSKEAGLSILDISFEKLVFDTNKSLELISNFTGRDHHNKISKILKKQKLPRKNILDGRGHTAYGWKKNTQSDKDECKHLIANIKKECNVEIYDKMINIINWYNQKYPSILSSYN